MFGFPKVQQHQVNEYKSSFLRSVVIHLHFPPVENLVKNDQQIQELFSNLFPRITKKSGQNIEVTLRNGENSPVFKPIISPHQELEMKSEDGKRELSISNDSIKFTISGQSYKNFNSLSEEIILFRSLCEEYNINVLNRISIRKLNIIDFDLRNAIEKPDEVNHMVLVNSILNTHLASGLSHFPNPKNIARNLNSVNYIDGNNKLNFIYGFILNQDSFDAGQIILDIDLYKEGSLESGSIIEACSEINDEIFNLFDWSISDTAKNILKRTT